MGQDDQDSLCERTDEEFGPVIHVETVDLTEGMLLVYRVDLAANVSLVNHFFPDRETLDGFSEKLKPVREQLKSMGAKVEINDGPVWGFKVAGDVTLDMLANGLVPSPSK